MYTLGIDGDEPGTRPEEGLVPDVAQALSATLAMGWDLGPACEAALARPRARRALALHLARGSRPEDALMVVLARAARRDGTVAGELLADLMGELLEFGASVLPHYMRRLHDPDDLVVSVLGDCFQELFHARVYGRRQLVALIRGRIRWKSRDRGRRMTAVKRREDQDSEERSADLDCWSAGPSPSAHAAAREELQRLARRLRSLEGRDRKILALHFAQHPLPEIALRVGTSASTVRRVVRRLMASLGAPP